MFTTVVQPLMTQMLLVFIGYTNANIQNNIKTSIGEMECLYQELGYTPDWSLPFKFEIKSREKARVTFYDRGLFACEAILGMVRNQESFLKCYDSWTPAYMGKVLNEKLFMKFKIQYENNVLQLYRHNDVNWIQLLKLDHVKNFQPTSICLLSQVPAEWIIYPPEKSSPIRKAWKTKPTLANIKILDEVVWKKEASNLGICTLLCNKDDRCMSFNFNQGANTCQGHSRNYHEVEGRNTQTESGAMHYYRQET